MSRAFNGFATHLWRGAHGYDRMNFTHDFQADLALILTELDSGRPFAFNRFADGELAILEGRDIPTADGWSAVNVSDKFRERLKAALTYRDKDYYVGIGCPCCNRDEWQRLMKLAGREPDDPQVTFSNVFVNGNTETVGMRWADRPIKLVCNSDKTPPLFRVPENAVNSNWDYHRLLDTLLMLGPGPDPIFVAAGPIGKIIVAQYYAYGCPRQIIDVGSFYDLWIRGAMTRSYHDPDHPNRKKICQWSA